MPDFAHDKNLPAQPDPFLWLIEGRSPSDGPILDPDGSTKRVLRLTPNREDVEFDTDSAGAPLLWYAYPIGFGEIEADLEGSRTTLSMTLSAAYGEATKWWEVNDYLRSHVIRLHLVHKNQLDNPSAKVTHRFRVADTEISLESITLHLAAGNYVDFDVPLKVMTPTCRWRYRGPGCFFIGDPGDAELGDCALTRQACDLRGDWEDANGLDRIHPRQFGGLPNLTSGGTL